VIFVQSLDHQTFAIRKLTNKRSEAATAFADLHPYCTPRKKEFGGQNG
jgi:hypothetical protein